MTGRATRRLLAITAMAWLSTPLGAGEIIEVKIDPTGEERRGKQEGGTGKAPAPADAFMAPSRLNIQNPPPSKSPSGQKGSDMQKQIHHQFLATTRAHWIGHGEDES